MKKHFPSLLLFAVLFAAGARAAGDVVFVDVQEVFKRFYKTQLAQDQIRQQADDIKFERESMEEEVKVLKEEVETLRTDARDETLSEDTRDSKRNQLEEKLVELQKNEQEMIDFEKLRMQQLEQQNTRMSRKLFDEIRETVVLYSKEQGFSGVIDRSAQSRAGMQVVLFANPKKDITADVLMILNEGHEELPDQEPSINVEG
ncbi:MAG: OmpH family outer membrane protein [Verrucomicrobiota bacterium]